VADVRPGEVARVWVWFEGKVRRGAEVMSMARVEGRCRLRQRAYSILLSSTTGIYDSLWVVEHGDEDATG